MALTGTSLFLSFICLRVFELSVENVRWGEQVFANKGEDVSWGIPGASIWFLLAEPNACACRLDLPSTGTVRTSKKLRFAEGRWKTPSSGQEMSALTDHLSPLEQPDHVAATRKRNIDKANTSMAATS